MRMGAVVWNLARVIACYRYVFNLVSFIVSGNLGANRIGLALVLDSLKVWVLALRVQIELGSALSLWC